MGAKDVIIVDIDSGQARRRAEGGRDARRSTAARPTPCSRSRRRPAAAPGRVIDFVGSGATVNLAVNSIIKGGTIVVVGLYGGDVTVPTPYLAAARA